MPTTDRTLRDESSLARPDTLVRGGVAGVGAWLLGYLVAYVWRAEAVAGALRGVGLVSQLLGGEAIPAWKGVAWLFLNAHFADTEFPTVAGGTRTANFVTGGEGSTVLLALPPLLLAVAGLAVAYGRSADAADRARVGATVALGYLPLSAAAALASVHALGGTEATIGPDLVTAVLLAGGVYPLVFGALGGAASAALE